MNDKTNRPGRFPGFFECQAHDSITPLIEGKPQTICHSCFKRINGNLTLYLAQTMVEGLRLENLVVQHTDMIENIIERLDEIDSWIDRLANGKTNGKKGPS